MNRHRIKSICEILFLMVALQMMLLTIEYTVACIVGDCDIFFDKMLSMISMIFLTVFLLFYAKFRKIRFSVLPFKFNKKYVLVSVFTLILLILTPSNYLDGGRGFWLLLYGSIVTPIYEELLFRGYIWNRLKMEWNDENLIFLINTGLFSFWHVGYIIPAIASGKWMAFTKLGIGLIYGFILGYTRKKTKCCYSTMLLHGAMNSFLG